MANLRVPAVTQPSEVNNTEIINGYVTLQGNRPIVRRRPGVERSEQFTSSGNLKGHSMAWYPDANTGADFIVHAGQALYRGQSGTKISGASTVGSSGDYPTFQTNFNSEMIVQDWKNDDLWVVDSADTVTQVQTATHGVSNMVPGVVSLDGYLLIADEDGKVYNSTLNSDPTLGASWPGDFVEPDFEDDVCLRIERYGNYVVVFGKRTLHFLYNAGNAAGSPLSVLKGSSQDVGCLNGASARRTGDSIVFAARHPQSNAYVGVLDGFEVKKVSPPSFDRLFDSTTTFNIQSGSPDDCFTSVIQLFGNELYIYTSLDGLGLTYVLDINTGFWYRWQTQDGGSTQNYFYALSLVSSESTTPRIHCLMNSAQHLFRISTITEDEDISDGSAQVFPFTVIIPNVNAGSAEIKFCYRLDLQSEKYDDDTFVKVSWTDDDYANYSTARNMSIRNQASSTYPSHLTRLGSFRNRTFKIVQDDTGGLVGFGIEALYLDVQAPGLYGILNN